MIRLFISLFPDRGVQIQQHLCIARPLMASTSPKTLLSLVIVYRPKQKIASLSVFRVLRINRKRMTLARRGNQIIHPAERNFLSYIWLTRGRSLSYISSPIKYVVHGRL